MAGLNLREKGIAAEALSISHNLKAGRNGQYPCDCHGLRVALFAVSNYLRRVPASLFFYSKIRDGISSFNKIYVARNIYEEV